VRRTLNCPCGTAITAADEDELVERTQEHLRVAHPGREYSREEILLLAW
jgi:predicted small metal-binding protein